MGKKEKAKAKAKAKENNKTKQMKKTNYRKTKKHLKKYKSRKHRGGAAAEQSNNEGLPLAISIQQVVPANMRRNNHRKAVEANSRRRPSVNIDIAQAYRNNNLAFPIEPPPAPLPAPASRESELKEEGRKLRMEMAAVMNELVTAEMVFGTDRTSSARDKVRRAKNKLKELKTKMADHHLDVEIYRLSRELQSQRF